jgi:hypothetical protein
MRILSGKEVPFHLELRGAGDKVVGTLVNVNGRERYASSSGTLSEGHLVLHFDYYANTLEAKLTGGLLNGTFSGRNRSVTLIAHSNAQHACARAGKHATPALSGVAGVDRAEKKHFRLWCDDVLRERRLHV